MAIYRAPFIAVSLSLFSAVLTGCSPEASETAKLSTSPLAPRVASCGIASSFAKIAITISDPGWDTGRFLSLETVDRNGDVIRNLGWVTGPLAGEAPIAIWLERRIGIAGELGGLGSIVRSFAEPNAISEFLDRMSPIDFESALMRAIANDDASVNSLGAADLSKYGDNLPWHDATDIVRDALDYGEPRFSFYEDEFVAILLRQHRGVDGVYLYFIVLDHRSGVQIEISNERPLVDFDDSAIGWISICLW